MKFFHIALPWICLFVSPAAPFAAELFPNLSSLSEARIRDAAIAFVNMSTAPGLEGAVISVDNNERTSDQWRSSLGFNAEFTLQDYVFNGYWGLALMGGRLEDKITLIDDNGQPVLLDLTREVVALRGSVGLSFPIDQHFKLRPFLSLIVSDLQSKTVLDGQYVIDNNLPSNTFRTSAQMWSTIASLDAVYDRWFDEYQVSVLGEYNWIYTQSFSTNSPALDSEDWNETLVLKGMISGPTELISAGRPWRWNTYAIYTNFLSHDKKSLGYQSLIEVGAGMDWQINIKPLDWFGWEYVGFKAGMLFGDKVDGYSIGLTAR